MPPSPSRSSTHLPDPALLVEPFEACLLIIVGSHGNCHRMSTNPLRNCQHGFSTHRATTIPSPGLNICLS